jgi:hypothetical protein
MEGRWIDPARKVMPMDLEKVTPEIVLALPESSKT